MDARKGKDKLEWIKKDSWVREEHVLSAGINQKWYPCETGMHWSEWDPCSLSEQVTSEAGEHQAALN